jgi:hypothetical protein
MDVEPTRVSVGRSEQRWSNCRRLLIGVRCPLCAAACHAAGRAGRAGAVDGAAGGVDGGCRSRRIFHSGRCAGDVVVLARNSKKFVTKPWPWFSQVS